MQDRRIVGWALSDRMTSNLTLTALRMALVHRDVRPGLIHHSDQGSQHADGTYRDLRNAQRIEASLTGVGTCYDCAPVESFFATLKTEGVHLPDYATWHEARVDIFACIEAFYNRQRAHSSPGGASPNKSEAFYHRGAVQPN